MRGHLSSGTVGVVAGAYRAEEMVQGCLAHGESQRAISVVQIKPVIRAPQVGRYRHLNGFMPSSGNLEEDLALTL